MFRLVNKMNGQPVAVGVDAVLTRKDANHNPIYETTFDSGNRAELRCELLVDGEWVDHLDVLTAEPVEGPLEPELPPVDPTPDPEPVDPDPVDPTPPTPTPTPTVSVASGAELVAAMQNATGGEVIKLVANKGAMAIGRPKNKDWSANPVTVVGAPGSWITYMFLDGTSGVKFIDCEFRYTWKTGAGQWDYPIQILGGRHFDFEHCEFTSTGNGNNPAQGWGRGLRVMNVRDLRLHETSFDNHYQALKPDGTNAGLIMTNCTMQNVRGDGIEGNFSNVLIDGCTFRAMNGVTSGDRNTVHPDYLSMQGDNVTFTNNRVLMDDGRYTQVIFCPWAMKNWNVSDNYIEGFHHHAITLGNIDGLRLDNNEVVEVQGAHPFNTPKVSAHTPSINIGGGTRYVSKLGNTLRGTAFN